MRSVLASCPIKRLHPALAALDSHQVARLCGGRYTSFNEAS